MIVARKIKKMGERCSMVFDVLDNLSRDCQNSPKVNDSGNLRYGIRRDYEEI